MARSSNHPHHVLPYADPLKAGRHPFQTYMLACSVIGGLPLAFGRVAPASVNAALPPWLVSVWGLMLFVGASVALCGSYWRGNYANALTIERMGLSAVGSAAAVYGFIIIAANGSAGLVPAAITLGFGLSCAKRSRDIGKIVQRAAVEMHDRHEVLKEPRTRKWRRR